MEFYQSNKVDNFESPDFYQIDDLLTEEHLLIRQAVRDFIKKEISPIIEDAAQKAGFELVEVRDKETWASMKLKKVEL